MECLSIFAANQTVMKNTPVSKFIQAGEWQKAFSAARKFFFGLTKEQKRSIEIAADCCNELRRPFYDSIGVDWVTETENAKTFLSAKFG